MSSLYDPWVDVLIMFADVLESLELNVSTYHYMFEWFINKDRNSKWKGQFHVPMDQASQMQD